jgi:hypothetical protein
MEVAAIALSLSGLMVAVILALKDERRSRHELAHCLARLQRTRGPGD